MTQILHVITGLRTGGAEMMLYKIATTQTRFEPIVVSLRDLGTIGPRLAQCGIKVHELNLSKATLPKGFFALCNLIKELQPRLIQGWMYHGNLMAQWSSDYCRRNQPVLWNIRHSLYDIHLEKLSTRWTISAGRRFSRRPARIIYNAQISANQHENYGFAPGKREVIPNGFDLDHYKPSVQARKQIRRSLGLADDTPLIGLIARYHPAKGHTLFLEAAAQLLQRRPEAHFLLAGHNVDESNSELDEIVRRLNMHKHVHLLGERNDIPALTAALDVATSTSTFGEGFSNALGEAMACGIPCVATDIGDAALILGSTGKIVPSHDATALATGWEQLLELLPEQRKQLGQAARKHIQSNFSLDAIVKRYEALYQALLDESH